jgi:hypothetical protein
MKKLIAGLAVAAVGATGIAAPVLAKGAKAPGDKTLYEIVAGSPVHETLQFAIDATAALAADDPTVVDVKAALSASGVQFTLFAPTDDAFEKVAVELAAAGLGDGTVGTLAGFLVENGLLDDVLLYHATEGRRFANSVVPVNGEKEIETLLGASLTAKVGALLMDASAATEDAKVTTANLSASNGVLHIIDNVLVPLS